MFDQVELRADADPATCRALVERLGEVGPRPTPVLLMLADQPGLDLEALVSELSNAAVPVIGGVFPALIHGSEVHSRGALGVAFSASARRVVIRNLFEPANLIGLTLSQLRTGTRAGGLTLSMLVDGQAAGSATALLEAARLEFLHLGADFIGAGAGYWSVDARPCLFTERELLPRGSGIVLAIDRRTSVEVDHGWSALGAPFFASRVRDTTLFELDWQPAIDVYAAAISRVEPSTRAGGDLLEQARRFPLAIVKHHDELVVRDPVSLTEDGGIFTLGAIPDCSLVVPVSGAPENLLAAATVVSKAVRRRSEEREGRTPAAALVLDCASRLEAIGDRFGEELARVQREFEQPIAGALSLGGIASRRGRAVNFFNRTVVVGAR
ncbi:MAG: FIST C-terminal domain-containing protein [Deltaproteobacteria bacterium]|nr:FIST C-terminal domain-containing protein [Deltaproteobacteria bacterium]